MKKMIFVPRPFPQESPTSLLMRAAQKNGYQNVAAMCRGLAIEGFLHWVAMRTQQHPLFDLLCQEAPPLASLLGQAFYRQPQKKLSTAAKIYINGKAVPGDIFRTDFCPCPRCLADGYTRPAQDLKIVDTCPYHNTPLMMVCPQCSAHNKWYRLNGFKCACGFDYQKAHTLPPLPQRRIIFNTSFGYNSARNILNKTYKDDLLCSALFPKLLGTNEQKIWITNQIQDVLNRELYTHNNLPLRVFEAPWQKVKDLCFRKFALDFLRNNYHQDEKCITEHCCRHIELSFDELSIAIDSTTKARHLIQTEHFLIARHSPSNIIYYKAKNLCSIMNAKLDRRQSHTNKLNPGLYSSLNQAAIKLHTNKTALGEIIKAGLIPGTIAGDRAYFIPNDAINTFSQNYVFSTELAKTCGFSTRSIIANSNKLKLKLAFTRVTSFFPAVYLRSSVPNDLTKLIKIFLRRRIPRIKMGLKLLRELSMKVGLNTTTTRFILTHHCGCVNPNWWISKQETEALINWRREHLTIKDVCARTKFSRLLIDTRFIHSGLIKPEKIYRTNFIKPDDMALITNHLNNFLSIIQIARLFSVSENKIRRLATQGELKTSTLNHKNGREQILIKRTQKNWRKLRQL